MYISTNNNDIQQCLNTLYLRRLLQARENEKNLGGMIMSMKRKAVSLLSLLTLPMVLAACGNSDGSSSGEGSEGKTEIKITWRNTGKTIK